MKKSSLIFLIVALGLLLLASACASQEGNGTAIVITPAVTNTLPALGTETLTTGTGTPLTGTETTTTAAPMENTPLAGITGTPGTPVASTTGTVSIPVTGSENILVEAQFCIDTMAHALLVMPDTATFEVVNPATTVTEPGLATGCNAIDTFNGRQIVLCRAEQGTTMTLNICTKSTTCTELAVNLQTCPEATATRPAATDATGSPISTLPATSPTATPLAGPTVTPVVVVPTITP